jgi:hypothetical protein
MTGNSDNDATPATFLKGLSDALAEQEGVDAELARILADHILQDPQQQHCVAHAHKAIAELAVARAKSSES